MGYLAAPLRGKRGPFEVGIPNVSLVALFQGPKARVYRDPPSERCPACTGHGHCRDCTPCGKHDTDDLPECEICDGDGFLQVDAKADEFIGWALVYNGNLSRRIVYPLVESARAAARALADMTGDQVAAMFTAHRERR